MATTQPLSPVQARGIYRRKSRILCISVVYHVPWSWRCGVISRTVWLCRAEFRIGDTPARFTKELRFAQTRKLWLHPGTLLSRLPQLYAFSNVQTLVIASLTTSVFHPITLPVFFGHVFPQVLNLRLHYPVACTTSLVRFILTFPNISNLEVQHPRWVKSACGDRSSQGPRGSCRSPFDGTLFLCRFGEKFDEFISLLAEQPINFRKVRLRQCGFSSTPAIHNLLDAISGTLRVLDVAFLERGECTAPTDCGLITYNKNRAEVGPTDRSRLQRLERVGDRHGGWCPDGGSCWLGQFHRIGASRNLCAGRWREGRNTGTWDRI